LQGVTRPEQDLLARAVSKEQELAGLFGEGVVLQTSKPTMQSSAAQDLGSQHEKHTLQYGREDRSMASPLSQVRLHGTLGAKI
jgi:hypothetical protein